MLKGRSKKFAPKKPVRSTATASSRPSVPQIPEASQSSQQDLHSVPVSQNVDVPAAPVVEASLPQPSQEAPEAVAAVTQDGHAVRSGLKRKEREADVAPPPAKRIPIPAEEPVAPVLQVRSQVESPDHENEVPSSPKSTIAVEPSVEQPQNPVPRAKIIPPKKKTIASLSEPPTNRIPAERQDGPSTQMGVPSLFTSPEHTPIPPLLPTTVISSIPATPEISLASTSVAPDTGPVVELARIVSPDNSPAPPEHRYPTPENIARLPEETQNGPSNMGRAGGDVAANGPARDNAAALRPGEVGQNSEIVPTRFLNPDGTSGGEVAEQPASVVGGEATPKPKKKATKRKKVQPQEDGADARTTVDIQLNKPRRVAGPKKPRRKKNDAAATRGRKRRAATPDGASDEEIDQSTLTMMDLCKDLRIGKKFSKHEEIKARIREKYDQSTREKMKRKNPEVTALVDAAPRQGAAEGEAGPSEPAEPAAPAAEAEEAEEAPIVPGSGIQMRLVNNQLVVDDTSTQIDRQARGQVDEGIMQHVLEDDFTRVVTSGTYMKREKAQLWDHAATARFYEGLAQFGTDFEMIAKLFPHRSRRQVKLKFNKEERINSDKITQTLIGPKKKHIDLKHFEKMSDLKLEETADIVRENEEFEQMQLLKEKEENEREAEITRQKKAAIHGEASGTAAQAKAILGDVSDAEDELARDNRGKGPPKGALKSGGKKNKHSAYGGGEEVTILGTIER
ncbi:uncharacterized protein L3040_004210 [Drepanopeziza brunnea f. sp. 'multigermtubi']|uniref:BZIP domain-containing protein n=1 Tax=Marssonina brunnea f. sp. multigermtubi (strain MB_m1) TaxID=1072389 RepID=K1X5U5_MARBU|nr:uncharacterized protein MBM_01184 [Drepanopeziza brunnea f. sp. 'multigermtubi' MB_m1]EKD20502.1 hypothetical protein MBM_01184 [Drepanopeziza brunnea f. sp. 'multigermtubi' MB_m1]KAJ5042817.1 hypothetical protein L3040_004210 [Drepanopeziza brunnea f. sp. 'multigermtubi']